MAAGVTLAVSLSAQEPSGPIAAPLAAQIDALGEQSSWEQDARFEGDQPDKSARGVYPVGNGRVFGYLGLGKRANTVQALTGPRYQTDAAVAPKGHFGELSSELVAAGAPVELPIQRVRRVRGANFVVSEDAAPDGLALRVLTFAAPDDTQLTQVLEVVNRGSAAVSELELHVVVEGPATGRPDGLVKRYASERRPALALFRASGARTGADRLILDVGTLAPGARWNGVATMATANAPEGVPPADWQPAPPALDQAAADAERTLQWWRKRLEGTLGFDTDHRKLRDLVDDWKVMMVAQQCAESGVVASMINHRGARIRDGNGPLLFFLRMGMWDDAKAWLQFVFSATQRLEDIPARIDLDLDRSPASLAPTDWSKVTVPAAETPSWVILQHYWYWRATRDTTLIRAHWPLLDTCLKRQQRTQEILMPFAGDEPYMHGALYSLFPERVADGSGFIAEAGDQDRAAWSLPSSVLFLLCVQAVGDLVDALDREANPEDWAGGESPNPPGRRYTERAFRLMADLEKRFWLEDEKHFAPARSPVTDEPHHLVVGNANLMPLWAGWTYPTGEKSRDNLRNTLARLWRRGHRIGTTPTVGYATGDLQGMLLVGMAERDARQRLDCMDELLRMAEPAGEWGELYDPRGRPVAGADAEWPNRCRPAESGTNVDAILFALCGVRYAAIANWDDDDIRLKLRIPHGGRFVTWKNLRKDQRELHVFAEHTMRRLDDDERETNERQPPAKRRDPNVAHKRFDFRVELVSEDPPKGYWDLAVNAANTMFPRYLWSERKVCAESAFWSEDRQIFFPPSGAEAAPVSSRAPSAAGDDASLLVLTARSEGARIAGAGNDGVTVIDTGLPWSAAQLAAALLDGGQPTHPTLMLDLGYDQPGTATFKTPSFWSQAPWRDALEQYRQAGGVVLTASYLTSWEVQGASGWTPATTADNAALTLDTQAGPTEVRASFTAPNAGEVVLRLGSGCGFSARLNGEEVFARAGSRAAIPDADQALVQVREGTNVLEVRLLDDGSPQLWARVTDRRGLPLAR